MTPEQKEKMKLGRERAAAEKKAKEEAALTEQPADNTQENTQDAGKADTDNTASETQPESTSKTYSEEEMRVLVEQSVAQAVQAALANQPQVIRVSADAPIVKMLFQCECSPENVIYFGVNGKFGSITGRQGRINVTKEAFLGEFRDVLVQALLASRELIVLDGLTDEERAAHGVLYGENEFLPEAMFNNLLDNTDELLNIYPDLCPAYKDMVAIRFATAYDNGDARVTNNRELIAKLNAISKKCYADLDEGNPLRKGAFAPLLERMNAEELGE